MAKFSALSTERLSTCDIRLQDILNEIIKYYDFTVLTGHRTRAEQDAAVAAKRSKTPWPKSKHNSFPSMAVDIAPWPIPDKWGEDWRDRVKFYELKALVFFVAAKKDIKIRYGGDWDQDYDYKDNMFNDLVHFEIVE